MARVSNSLLRFPQDYDLKPHRKHKLDDGLHSFSKPIASCRSCFRQWLAFLHGVDLIAWVHSSNKRERVRERERENCTTPLAAAAAAAAAAVANSFGQ